MNNLAYPTHRTFREKGSILCLLDIESYRFCVLEIQKLCILCLGNAKMPICVSQEYKSLFYNTHDDLISKTEELIINKTMTYKSSEIIKSYDWSNMINQYDIFFENF